MADSILNPISVWDDFTINNELKEEVLTEKSVRNIVFKEVYLAGRKTELGEVKIYALISYDKRLERLPAVLILPNFSNDIKENLVKDLAKKGYYAVMIDIRGKVKNNDCADGTQKYTIYPNDISYANYEEIKEDLQNVEGTVKNTCWYEWVCVAKYAFNYIKSLKQITKIGALGVRRGASVLWQLAATEPELACSVITFNAGWRAYRNYFKFGVNSEPDFSLVNYKYLAGIEPQSYAMYVKSPTMLISPTNSILYDADRSTDTIARVQEGVYTAFDFSLGSNEILDSTAYDNILIFFDKYLNGNKVVLPKEVDISTEENGGVIEIKVSCDKKNLKGVEVYSAEDTINPAKRAWNKKSVFIKKEADGFVFNYTPDTNAEVIFFFAKVKYENGFTLSSRITAKRLKNKINYKNKMNVIYSSNYGGESSSLYSARLYSCDNGEYMLTDDSAEIKYKKGPMEIVGAYAKGGVISYKFNNDADKLDESAILKFDLFTKEENLVNVKLVVETASGEMKEYFASTELKGNDIWQNVIFEMANFKTELGQQLKSYDGVMYMIINCTNEYLVNNVLWL